MLSINHSRFSCTKARWSEQNYPFYPYHFSTSPFRYITRFELIVFVYVLFSPFGRESYWSPAKLVNKFRDSRIQPSCDTLWYVNSTKSRFSDWGQLKYYYYSAMENCQLEININYRFVALIIMTIDSNIVNTEGPASQTINQIESITLPGMLFREK